MKKSFLIVCLLLAMFMCSTTFADDAIIWDYNNWDYSNQGMSSSGETGFSLSTTHKLAEGISSTGNSGSEHLYTKSTWGFNANSDFGISTKFYVNNAFSDQETIANANLYIRISPSNVPGAGYVEYGIGNRAGTGGSLERYYYRSYDLGSGNSGVQYFDRESTYAGDFWIYYDHPARNVLFHKSPDGTAGSWTNMDVFAVPTDDNDVLGVEFGLRSNALAPTAPYNMDFYNINMTGQVTAAPEPISAALFLIGGAGLVVARRRKKKTASK